jgi:hypothetical protein
LQVAPFNFKLSGANVGSGAGGQSWTISITNAGVTTATTDVCHVSGHSGSTDEGVPTCD